MKPALKPTLGSHHPRAIAAIGASLGMLALAGCSGPIGVYHNIQGGAIAQTRQAPPGADAPYPNLANVPAEPAALAPGTQAAIAAQVLSGAPDVSAPSPAALAGLALPGAPPPPPGLSEPHQSTAAAPLPVPYAPAVAATPATIVPPLALAFPPGTAILPGAALEQIAYLAAKRGGAAIQAGGFGDNISLPLAIARAQRIADALTAAGVPPAAIRITAMAAGSGGFAQLVY